MDIKTKDYTWAMFTPHEQRLSFVVRSREQRVGPFGPSVLNWFQTTWLSALTMQIHSTLGVVGDPSLWFDLNYFDQNFHLIFWLKVNNDTVFETSILEYDRSVIWTPSRCKVMSQIPWILTGPENQHLLCKPHAVSNFEAYGNIQKCF